MCHYSYTEQKMKRIKERGGKVFVGITDDVR